MLQPQWADFPLDGLLDEISRNFRPVAEQQDLRLVVRKTDLRVRSDYVMLSRVLSNLVSNSGCATVEGGVLVGARRRGRLVRIDVRDNRRASPCNTRRKAVFEELYRLRSARRPAWSGGMGLGQATQRLAGLP